MQFLEYARKDHIEAISINREGSYHILIKPSEMSKPKKIKNTRYASSAYALLYYNLILYLCLVPCVPWWNFQLSLPILRTEIIRALKTYYC